MTAIRVLYDPCESFFFRLWDRVPFALQPFVGYILLALLIVLYLCALRLLGKWAESKGQRYWLGVWLGVITGPLLAAIFVGYLNDTAQKAPASKARARKRASTA